MFLKGLFLGLAAAPFCAVTCVPVLLPMLVVRGQRGWTRNAAALGEFLAGRLGGYLLFGAVLGAVGRRLEEGLPVWAVAAAYGFIGLAMVLAAAGQVRTDSRFCLAMRRLGRGWTFPVVLGALTGVSLCPPFVAAATEAVRTAGAAAGAMLFAGFFLGASLVLLPAVLGGVASTSRPVRSLGTVACGVVGMMFMASAGRMAVQAGAAAPAPIVIENVVFRQVLPEAEVFVRKKGAAPYHAGYDARGRLVGYVFNTAEVAPTEAKGYNGPVPMLVGMDTAGRIVAVREIQGANREDRDLVEAAFSADFLDRFAGHTPDDLDVDAVSGATYTCNAIIGGVRAAARRVAEAAGIRAVHAEAARATSPWSLPVTYVMLALFGLAVFGYLRRVGWLRHVTLALSALLLGFWWTNPLSVRHLSDFLRDGIGWLSALAPSQRGAAEPGAAWGAAAEALGRYLPLLLAGGGALFVGRVWCGWICPFGAVTEWLGRLAPKGLRLRVGPVLDRRMRLLKFLLLVGVPVAVVATGVSQLQVFEPFLDALSLRFLKPDFPPARLAWLLFLGFASLVCVRFYCKYLCPVGAALGFLSLQRLRPRRKPAGCRSCANCGLDCMMAPEGVAPPDLSGAECLACGACATCPRSVPAEEASP